MTIELHGCQLTLHPSGALWIAERRMLVIADLHLGKVMHFRKHGIAAPIAAMAANFAKLTRVADEFCAETICFLGDLSHSDFNLELELLRAWISSRREQMILVRGNHDLIGPEYYELNRIQLLDWLEDAPLLLNHEPKIRPDLLTICGHLHPGVRLRAAGGELLKLPCFHYAPQQLILPAFGSFTGRHHLRLGPGEIAYAIAGAEVIAIPGRR